MFKIKRVVLIATYLAVFGMGKALSQDTLTVMYYNVLNFPGNTPERVSYFRITSAYVQPDVLLVTELINDEGADNLLQNGLNVTGKSNYQKAVFTDGPDSDNMLFYNSDKLALYSQDTIGTELRVINEYVLYAHSEGAVSSTDTTFFYFYMAHLKASDGTDNKLKRRAEVMRFKQHINQISNTENIFFGGDLNFYTNSEPAYDSLLSNGIYPLNDPLPSGSWHDNAAFAPWHTQSTRKTQFGGGASGGIDDRFDFILFSDDVLTGSNKVTYVANSCIALGNDGNHFNESLLDMPFNTAVPDSVLNALYYMSDHLPVICKLSVEVDVAPVSHYLDLSVMLEGPFNGIEMTATSNQFLPMSQPFNQAPWNYNGGEALTSIENQDIVDWVLVELRSSDDQAGNATSNHTVWKQACLLLKNGSIVDTGQINPPLVEPPLSGNIYTLIRQRNHLDIMAANPLPLSNDLCQYNFISAAEQVYGSSAACKELAPGIWGMIAGDADGNGEVSQSDIEAIWGSASGQSGYLPADLNFDGQTDNLDKNEFMIINLGKTSNIPQ